MMRKGTAQKLNNQKLKQWFIDNQIVIIYFIFAFFIDVIGVFAVEKSPIISKPFILIGFLLFVSGIALQFKSNIKRFVFCIIFIVVQAFFDLAFVVVYDMTGQYFDYGMLKLRNDAFGMLESIPMNFIAFYSAFFFCVFYILYGIRIVKRRKKVEKTKARKFSYIAIMILGLVVMSSSLYRYNSPLHLGHLVTSFPCNIFFKRFILSISFSFILFVFVIILSIFIFLVLFLHDIIP